jgi:hypothetical protein
MAMVGLDALRGHLERVQAGARHPLSCLAQALCPDYQSLSGRWLPAIKAPGIFQQCLIAPDPNAGDDLAHRGLDLGVGHRLPSQSPIELSGEIRRVSAQCSKPVSIHRSTLKIRCKPQGSGG